MLVCSGRCCMKRTQNFGRVGGFSCVSAFPILEPLSMHVLSSPHLLKERVGQGHTYIVPLQRDLNLTPSVDIPGELSNGWQMDMWTTTTLWWWWSAILFSDWPSAVLVGASSNQQPPSSGPLPNSYHSPVAQRWQWSVQVQRPILTLLFHQSIITLVTVYLVYYLRLEICEHNLTFR